MPYQYTTDILCETFPRPHKVSEIYQNVKKINLLNQSISIFILIFVIIPEHTDAFVWCWYRFKHSVASEIRLLNGDETWLHDFSPKKKRNMVWAVAAMLGMSPIPQHWGSANGCSWMVVNAGVRFPLWRNTETREKRVKLRQHVREFCWKMAVFQR